jgi:predicted kinase
VTTLTITRGLPGSGKTTYAREWINAVPGRSRVNRDDLRAQLHGQYLGEAERKITAVEHGMVSTLLNLGTDVICDDTNLRDRVARELRRVAVLAGAGFEVVDLTNVPVDECVRRDAERTVGHVGEGVIRSMHTRYLAGKPYPLVLPDESEIHHESAAVVPYVRTPGNPLAILVDIDGTVALKCDRSPYDETRVHEDQPNKPVVAAVRAMREAGYSVIFCSGRTDGCRDATKAWIDQHLRLPSYGLHMRAAGDMRRDSIVKMEIFDREIRDRWDVLGVFDDRRQVVDMWRALGLTVFQVADGNF